MVHLSVEETKVSWSALVLLEVEVLLRGFVAKLFDRVTSDTASIVPVASLLGSGLQAVANGLFLLDRITRLGPTLEGLLHSPRLQNLAN